MAKEKLLAKCRKGAQVDVGLAHIAATKADYVAADVDTAAETATVLNTVTAKLNDVITRLEDAGISLTS